VKGKLSYFFGTETLINFESVYDSVIRQEVLEMEAEGIFVNFYIH